MRMLRALGLYAVLTVALTWPFAANLRVMDAGDSAFFAWEIGWTLHALGTDPASLPHGNIFYPLRYTLGMDEPVFGTTVLALPLALFTGDAVLLYNVARLLTFLLSALTAYWLALELGVGEWVALVAGALAGLALLPLYRMHQKALGPEDYARGAEETILYSAPVESFLATSSWNRVYGEITDPFRASGPNNLFPGLVVPLLVLAGAVALWRRGDGASGRRGRPGRSGRSRSRERSWPWGRGSECSTPTSGPGRGRCCATRFRCSR